MTEGPLFGKIILFILPLLATNLLQTFYSTADIMVVSLSPEVNAVGAIGVTGAFLTLITNLFMCFSVGGTVAVARRIGAGDTKTVSGAVHTTILVGGVMGTLGALTCLFVARPVLILMGVKEPLLELAVLYTRLVCIGTPFSSLTNFAIAIFRAKGDTRTPLFVLTASGLLNVGLNLLFVLGFGMSVDGVALATAASRVASALALLWVLTRDRGACRFSLKKLRIDKAALWEIIRIGFPAGIQGAAFSLSNILIQSSILQVNNAMVPVGETYQPVVAGNAAASNLANFVTTTTGAVLQATTSFTGQNVGAGKYDRVWRVLWYGCLIGVVLVFLMGYAFILLRRPIFSYYGLHPGDPGSLDEIAYETAVLRNRILMSTYFIMGIQEAAAGVARGMGKSFSSMLIVLTGTCVFRLIWIFTVFRSTGTLASIYVAYPISWVLNSVALMALCLIILTHRTRAHKAQVAAQTF